MKLYNHKTKNIAECDLGDSVAIYTCGPTVYDYPHVGNWYTFVRYDLLVRTLRALGHEVNWVMNITDVGHLVSDADSGEDKMEKGARREGKSAWDVAKYYTDYFVDGLEKLNFDKITHLPKATDYINQQIEIVKTLEAKGYTYQISDGIYFNTAKFSAYADFADLNLSGQEEGARVEENIEKKNPSDFALWKFSPVDTKRDMEWESPWGKGFPGWHLECSAMIHDILGEPIDIHAGGIDHLTVHHTNEVAQSEAAFDKPLSKYWVHCNHIQVDGKKMSKSLNNFYTLEDIESKKFTLDVFRLHILNGHYRSQSEFSWDTLEATKQRLQNWIDKINILIQSKGTNGTLSAQIAEKQLTEVLSNDLNSPMALSLVDEQVNTLMSNDGLNYLKVLDKILGINLDKYIQNPSTEQIDLLKLREKARTDKDWALSDKLRDELQQSGLVIFDTEFGQAWSRLI